MFSIGSCGDIRISRGDTSPQIPLFINKGTELLPLRYELLNDDEVCIAVMDYGQTFETAVLKKVYNNSSINENGDVVIQFMPQDTELLDVGEYYYTIKLHNTSTGTVQTIIKATPFVVE